MLARYKYTFLDFLEAVHIVRPDPLLHIFGVPAAAEDFSLGELSFLFCGLDYGAVQFLFCLCSSAALSRVQLSCFL